MYLPRGAPVFAFLSLLICVSPTCVLSEDLKSRQNQNKDPPATTSGPASSVATTTSPIHALPHSSSSPSTGSGPSSTQGPTSTSKSATYFTVPITTPSTTTAVSCPTGPPRRAYEWCSASISWAMGDCTGTDSAVCACTLIGKGLRCLSVYCPSHTVAICYASHLQDSACALATHTPEYNLDHDYSCGTSAFPTPTDINPPTPEKPGNGTSSSSSSSSSTSNTRLSHHAPSTSNAAVGNVLEGWGNMVAGLLIMFL